MTDGAESEYYQQNKGYLAELADSLSSIQSLPLEPTDKKTPVAKWEGFFLCSPSDPEKQAKLWAEDNYVKKEGYVYYVSGIGMGFHIIELFEKICDEISFIVVAEKNLPIIKSFLSNFDLTKLLSSNRFYLLRDNDRSAVFKRLGGLQDMPTRGFKVTSQLNYYDALWQRDTLVVVRDYCDHQRTGVCTQILNAETTYRNVLDNLKDYLLTTSFKFLKDWFKDCPAIIVGAGPSVDNELPHLVNPRYRGGYVLFTTPTMLKPLLKIGRKPHFVTALDYHELSGRFYEDIEIDKSIVAIFEPKANRAIIEKFTAAAVLGRQQIAFLANEFIAWSLLDQPDDHPNVPSGSTVAHLCLYLADYMGCDPIIHIGQDLAFTEGRYYSDAVLNAHEWKKESAKRADPPANPLLRKKEGKQGNPAWQDEQMHSYHQQFEILWSDCKKRDVKVYDCSSLGIVKDNCENADFVEVLDKHVAGKMLHPHKFDYHRYFRTYDPDTVTPEILEKSVVCLQNRCEEILAFQKINEKILEIIESVDAADPDAAVETRKKITPLSQIIGKMSHAHMLCANFSGKAEMQRQRDDDKVIMEKLSGSVKLASQKERDLKFLPEMIETSKRLIEAYEGTIKELQKGKEPPK